MRSVTDLEPQDFQSMLHWMRETLLVWLVEQPGGGQVTKKARLSRIKNGPGRELLVETILETTEDTRTKREVGWNSEQQLLRRLLEPPIPYPFIADPRAGVIRV